jgi:hypothetical protein
MILDTKNFLSFIGASIKIHVMGIERRPKARPTCSIFEQKEPRTEPKLSLRSG